MTFRYMLLAAVGPLAVLVYGWAIARPASRLGGANAWAGAVALALALSLLSLAQFPREALSWYPVRSLLAVYAVSFVAPALAVTGTAVAVRSARLPVVLRAAVIVAVLAIVYLLAQHYARRFDMINAVA